MDKCGLADQINRVQKPILTQEPGSKLQNIIKLFNRTHRFEIPYKVYKEWHSSVQRLKQKDGWLEHALAKKNSNNVRDRKIGQFRQPLKRSRDILPYWL